MSYTKGKWDMINKLAIIPIFFLTMCGTAPVVDPPAHADVVCLSLNCPELLPKEELRGEIDIYEPMHWHSINQMFIRNARRTQIEKNMTLPSDSINSALENFWEQENGSNGSTESQELLQLSSDGNKPSS